MSTVCEATYVEKLADRVTRRADDPQGQNVRTLLVQTLGNVPGDCAALAQELESRPDLQAKLAGLIGYTPSSWLVECELDEINRRRSVFAIDAVPGTAEPLTRAFEGGLMGLCCSGGGIRSATFSLGVLQALAETNLLRSFDYLSSVSGGGYIHQWLAAWLKRESGHSTEPAVTLNAFNTVNSLLIPPPDSKDTDTRAEPVRWLQRYSNYLTPRRDIFSGDTWVAMATWLRNTLLNQVILISGLFFLLLIPHLLAPPASVVVSADPAVSPSTLAIMKVVAATTLMLLVAIATLVAARDLFVFWPCGPVQSQLFNERGVQLYVVVPMLAWAILWTVLQNSTWVLATAWLLLIFGLTMAFAGRALQAYVSGHRSHSATYRGARIILATLAIGVAAFLASLAGTAWTVLIHYLLADVLPAHVKSIDSWRVSLVLGPPLYLAAPLLALLVLIGLLGRTFYDPRREWLARLAAWAGLYAFVWVMVFGVSLFGHRIVDWLIAHTKTEWTAITGWLGLSAGGLFAGYSATTSGRAVPAGGTSRSSALEWLAVVGPYVFILGLFLVLAWFADEAVAAAYGHGALAAVGVFAIPAAICLLFGWRVDINEFSMHAFYRNRLARCYLGASNSARKPNPFTAFDEQDAAIAVSDLKASDGYPGPFPIFCATLNLTVGGELAWQERKAASFAFTPVYSGYDVGWTEAKGQREDLRFNGFVETSTYAYHRPGMHIATAVSVSGAALSPNCGYHTNPATAFLMTLFNARLGWWLLNPRVLKENGETLSSKAGGQEFPQPSPHFAVWHLVKELLGQTDDTNKYIYLSDGGHFDNMGLYELVRRRCRYIVICDGEEDGNLIFGGIAMAIRKCRTDFGADVRLDLRSLERAKDSEYSSRHVVVGTIRYPGAQTDETGVVVYLKASLTGDEPMDVLSYKKEHSTFPDDSTTDQWFTESQFESYRQLGHHVGRSTFEPANPAAFDCGRLGPRRDYFASLKDIWYPPTPEMERHQAAHVARFDALLQHVRAEARLSGLMDRLFNPGDGGWSQGRPQDAVEYARGFASELLEFAWTVYSDLNLVEPVNLDHPHSKGWIAIFTNWSKVDVVQAGWTTYRDSYSPQFRLFARTQLKLS